MEVYKDSYTGTERRKNTSMIDSEQLLNLVRDITKISADIEYVKISIDEIKGNHADEIKALKNDISDIRDKQACLESDISDLQNKPAKTVSSKLDKLLDQLIGMIPVGILFLLAYWISQGMPLPGAK